MTLRADMQDRTQSVQNGIPTRSMGTVGSARHPSFLTLQRGNAVRDAPRHTQPVEMSAVMSLKQINIGKIQKLIIKRHLFSF